MSNITFVCCIESGTLESLTLRMICSLRRWGGNYKNAEIIAVTPRLGPPLAKSTLQFLEENSVRYISSQVNSEAWFKYMNKPHALKIADEYVNTEYICWLDSDIVFLKEPFSSVYPFTDELYACASDKNIGTSGENDKFEPYWSYLCNILNICISDLPWIVTKYEQIKIRLYFNSGVFFYKRCTGFSEQYLKVCQQLLRSKIANLESGIYFTDQVALGLTVCIMGLAYCELPLADNFPVNSKKVKENHDLNGDIAILHHHNMMWQDNWVSFIKIIEDRNVDVASWLSSLGPITNGPINKYRIIIFFLSKIRELKLSLFLRKCKFVC